MNFFQSENYHVETTEYESTGTIHSINWFDSKGVVAAPRGLPASVHFHPSGNIARMAWFEAGVLHRGNDLPAQIALQDSESLEILNATWYWRGYEHRDGDLPSSIHIDHSDGRVCGLGFMKNGVGRDNEGLPGIFWINADGKMFNADEEPVEVNLTRFSEGLPRPPPISRPVFLAPG